MGVSTLPVMAFCIARGYLPNTNNLSFSIHIISYDPNLFVYSHGVGTLSAGPVDLTQLPEIRTFPISGELVDCDANQILAMAKGTVT